MVISPKNFTFPFKCFQHFCTPVCSELVAIQLAKKQLGGLLGAYLGAYLGAFQV